MFIVRDGNVCVPFRFLVVLLSFLSSIFLRADTDTHADIYISVLQISIIPIIIMIIHVLHY